VAAFDAERAWQTRREPTGALLSAGRMVLQQWRMRVHGLINAVGSCRRASARGLARDRERTLCAPAAGGSLTVRAQVVVPVR